MKNQLICLPENDQHKRFILAKKGKKNLLVIGLNPSTANEKALDSTSKNINQIALNNGFDGWLLVNLYPQRSSKPVDLDITEDKTLFWQNIHWIKHILDRDQFQIHEAWLCWGDGVDTMGRYYLKQAAGYLYRELKDFKFSYNVIGTTRSGNPCHPSPQSVNCHIGPVDKVKFEKFDFQNYVKSVKLEPEIKLNGLEFK
ncbi:hypothetical protein C7S20_18350 [Christiangramia fulva]|uniref:DUF1643 domain-containing protein n=1 Tax=Christiangramia fulva TaxID=2126553 RepID=A0A2R3Z9V8_9FLAO|nr:DUF1643 domain-containing protein [Christiangramia fulva]AVR47050.1 hypothetical protein C7S20_18350 [Christiangramia fulva]